MMCLGKASPTMAPTMAMVEAIKATGIARRKLARLDLSNPGPAAKAPESATSNSVPLTKSRWNGKKLLMIGTKRTPPPTPPSTATIPIRKVTSNKINGQIHQGGKAFLSLSFGCHQGKGLEKQPDQQKPVA
jgi:hypothetical protein